MSRASLMRFCRKALHAVQAKPVNHILYGGQRDVVSLAVAMCLGIARTQAFMQGNKRTAWAAMDAFLHLNGFDLRLADTDAVAELLLKTISGEFSAGYFETSINDNVFALDEGG